MEEKNVIENKDLNEVKNTKTVDLKVFSKKSFLRSEKYKKYFDIINSLLSEDTLYTKKQVDDKISKYLKGRV